MPVEKQVNFELDIVPKIKDIIKDTILATFTKLDEKGVH